MGDLGLGRHITAYARQKNDFNYSFSTVSSWLEQNDFNLANLESPIVTNCPTLNTGTFTFCGDPLFISPLVSNRFVLNLANNHILNFGVDGLSQTHQFLSQNNITYTPDFSTKTINGITFGFLGYDFITSPLLNPQTIINDIKIHKPTVDWLVVSIHWGNEYLPEPEKWRIDLAHLLVDAGADIIHGHHPHVFQPIEIYKNKPIYYSLGNFIFDQNWSYETSHSQIVRLTLSKTEILKSQSFPIVIQENVRPELDQTLP